MKSITVTPWWSRPPCRARTTAAFRFRWCAYPSIDTRRLVGYVAGYPFSPETALRVREEKVELLHTHCPIASAILARSLREVVDAPLVLTYHTKYDIDIAKAVKSRLLQESAIRALVQNVNACDEVWVVSRGAGENLRSLGYEGAYTVMENGVDVPRGRVSAAAVAAATAGYDLPDGVPLFLFVGRLMWYKGLHIILDALRALREQGQDFRMVFIGAGGDEKEVRAEVETLRLSDRCFFTGSIADRETLRAWYSRADLFLFPSTFDTNGLVVREAAASGCPSVLVAGKLRRRGRDRRAERLPDRGERREPVREADRALRGSVRRCAAWARTPCASCIFRGRMRSRGPMSATRSCSTATAAENTRSTSASATSSSTRRAT